MILALAYVWTGGGAGWHVSVTVSVVTGTPDAPAVTPLSPLITGAPDRCAIFPANGGFREWMLGLRKPFPKTAEKS
jgi:hypothetical protein